MNRLFQKETWHIWTWNISKPVLMNSLTGYFKGTIIPVKSYGKQLIIIIFCQELLKQFQQSLIVLAVVKHLIDHFTRNEKLTIQ